MNAGAASLGRAARAARDALSKGRPSSLDATRVQAPRTNFGVWRRHPGLLEADEPELKHWRA